ncbi:MAG: hypothetical protein JSS50_04405 [Proteobacteria bacterium]|nr:hypothetical protein [Pseudomonadota bacterium]
MRLLPYVIVFLIMMIAAKMFDAAEGSMTLLRAASGAASAEASEEVKKPEEKPAQPEAHEQAKTKTDAKSEGNKEAANSEHQAGKPAEPLKPKGDETHNEPKTDDDKQVETSDAAAQKDEAQKDKAPVFSESEVQLLMSLRKRREEIEQKDKALSVDLNIMRVIDQSVESKLQNLQKLQDELKSVMQNYEDKQNANINGLVKIYENMKPKDAAKIFDSLQMSVLIEVARQMKEAKLGPILAAMEPEKAKDLTVALASQRRLTDSIRNPILPFEDVVPKRTPESTAEAK